MDKGWGVFQMLEIFFSYIFPSRKKETRPRWSFGLNHEKWYDQCRDFINIFVQNENGVCNRLNLEHF